MSLLRFSMPLLLSAAVLQADVNLPAIFSDHAVLKKSAQVPVWGRAQPGEEVSVTLGSQKQKTTTGSDGKWRVNLDLSKSGPGPFDLTVTARNEIKRSDILVGEVWLASGQSNMEWTLSDSADAQTEIARSSNPQLRAFHVTRDTARNPVEERDGKWVITGPDTAGAFSGTAYYFGQKLQKTLQVPVGLIHASSGGTPAEAWTSPEAFADATELAASVQAKRKILGQYPMQKSKFVRDFTAWLKQTDRQDRPATDLATFTTGSTEGWTPVTLPGVVEAPGLATNGAIWLRRDIDISEAHAGLPFSMDLGDLQGYESVYWNGQLISQTTYETYRGQGYLRWLFLGNNLRKPGVNTLAIRIYAPSGVVKFPIPPRMDSTILDGTWLAKAEYELPALADDEKVPVPPTCPPREEDTAGYLFNAMIHPLIPYAISGVIWYQGESNASRGYQYRQTFPLMIQNWRSAWGQGDFPFYFAQIANFGSKPATPGESPWAETRESQSLALALPHTGQAVLMDIGEASNIHPGNKKDAGERLARLALAETYGKAIAAHAPVYRSLEIKDGQAIVHFDLRGGQLIAQPLPTTYPVNFLSHETAPLVRNSPATSQLEGFAICGADQKWVWAEAKVDCDKVIVTSPEVAAPVAVRYAWADNPTGNLYGPENLPVSPFRTDTFPVSTQGAKY